MISNDFGSNYINLGKEISEASLIRFLLALKNRIPQKISQKIMIIYYFNLRTINVSRV